MNHLDAVSPRKRPRQRRSRETVEAILEATAQVMSELGYDKTSTNRIAERAGVSIGSLYQYFPNKEAIVLELHRAHSDEMLERFGALAAEIGDASLEEMVRAFVRTMFAVHAADPTLHRALVFQVMHLGWDIIREGQLRAITLVREVLRSHRDRLVPSNLEMAAHVLVTTVDSLTHAGVLEDPHLLDDPGYEAEVVALVVRYLLGSGETAESVPA